MFAAYRALVEQDLRLAIIGHRLASANAPFCRQLEGNPGWVLHDERQYPDRDTARAAFGLRAPIAVAAVVPGGAADALGLRAGDGLLGLNGKRWAWRDEAIAKPNAKRIGAVKEEMQRAFAAGAVTLEVDTASGPKRFAVDPPKICASHFWVDASAKLDAGADGQGVRVTEGLMTFTEKDDGQLAAIVAHELAHNFLSHRTRLKTRGGRKAVLATEIEADRLSVWLMANAGFDPKAALHFAERYGRKTELGIFSDGTHLRWKDRVKVMQTEIEAMAAAPRQNGLLPPPLLAGTG